MNDCLHKNLIIHIDGLMSPGPGFYTIWEPGREIKIAAVCADCSLRGPWRNVEERGATTLIKSSTLRRAIASFYMAANRQDDRDLGV